MSVKSNVLSVVQSLESEPMSGFDWLTDALDIEWILNNDRTFKGARILVAFGGPNIWVNTTDNTVEGHWWGSSHIERFDDCIGLEDACEELFNC